MPNERAILCGGASSTKLRIRDDDPLRLKIWGQEANVNLSFEDIRRQLLSDIPSPFLDLIEIATYVYCADQAITRGGAGVDNLGASWRRKLFFRIPVRNPNAWNGDSLQEKLITALSFLTEDEYDFEFVTQEDSPEFQQYLFCAEGDDGIESPEEVVLFSGGLDSLGGAIQEAVIDKRRIALVHHKAADKLIRRHRYLLEQLTKKAVEAPPIHIPVSINKSSDLNSEYTQRSRSFLYASLASAIAQMLGLSRIRFYENGVVSMNLPPAAQVVGARATRTTHPQILNGFASLFTELSGQTFTVENPFLWKTKTDVLKLIARAECADLIRYSTSCAHTYAMTKLHPHCGVCSQCIDRKFAVLAAGLSDADPAEAYKVDLMVGERSEGDSLTMLTSYVEMANRITGMLPTDFFSEFGEASRILRHIGESANNAAMKVYELHKSHAQFVGRAMDNAIAANASDIRTRKLPATCLLRLVCDSSSMPGQIESPATAPTGPESEDEEDFMFRPENQTPNKQVWSVRFRGGKEFVLLRSRGAAYLHILLSNPGKPFPAIDLVMNVLRNPALYPLADSGDASDRQALTAYRATYNALVQELEE
ncbi:MAG: 7-cyano-7-deazaguanine synthase, partial [Planctomycetota bacterium]|nr:7-cyano-7-deazaguanine synthase [Planctomycetota bacterium]